jgi:hypothetical protein
MRFSRQERNPIENLDALDAKAFFAAVKKALPDRHRQPAVLLVGGSDFRSVALRQAQAHLRFDLRSSYWSHAALVLDWASDDLTKVTGVEVTLRPRLGQDHEPERAGITEFSLADYADDAAFPNLCIGALGDPSSDDPAGAAWREDVIAAARDPHSSRGHHNLYAWLAEWIRYAMIPSTADNPLQKNLPLPSAALVDHAFTTGGLDLIPAATSPSAAPEHLWATFKHWSQHLSLRWGKLQVWRRVKEPMAAS